MAENEATFRDANEQIQARALELEFPTPVPFLCECGEPDCHEIVSLSLDAYAEVRSEPAHFLVAPGHEDEAGSGSRVVAARDGHFVVEKVGVAGEVAERRDPRERAG
jgi:hypothetical protein